jgi:hypothetical protein
MQRVLSNNFHFQQLSKHQQYHMIEKVPSPLEYFSYTLNFQSLMAGPLIFYRDYIDFIDGCNIISKSSSNVRKLSQMMVLVMSHKIIIIFLG